MAILGVKYVLIAAEYVRVYGGAVEGGVVILVVWVECEYVVGF